MKLLPLGFGLALAALVGAVIFGVVTTRSDLQTLQTASQENHFWSAAQVEREFNALQIDVARQALKPNVTADAVRNRFKILQTQAASKQFLGLDGISRSQSNLDTLLSDLQPVVVELPDGPSNQLAKISNSLKDFETEIRTATTRILANDQKRISDIRNSMRKSLMLIVSALVVSLIVALALIFLSTRQEKKNIALMRDVESAASGRKKFFAMMSHEVRTPLNGILGSLALLREETDQNTRQHLVDEAHASALRLSHLVSDAVDLNADEKLEIKPSLFRMENFITSIKTALVPQIKRHGAELKFSESTQSKLFLKCDYDRLTQALSYIIGNALQRGGAKLVHLTISVQDEKLSVEIETDIILPHDAFGETLARGIVERLGGKVSPHETKRIVTIPVEVIELSAKLSFGSKALLHMYERLLNANGIGVIGDATSTADLVLAEVAQEPDVFSDLSNDNPGAALIACGVGPNSDFFDEVAKTPDDLMRAIYSALARHSHDMEITA